MAMVLVGTAVVSMVKEVERWAAEREVAATGEMGVGCRAEVGEQMVAGVGGMGLAAAAMKAEALKVAVAMARGVAVRVVVVEMARVEAVRVVVPRGGRGVAAVLKADMD